MLAACRAVAPKPVAVGRRPRRLGARDLTAGSRWSATPNPRRAARDVIAVPAGGGSRPPRPGPSRSLKWLCGSVIDDPDTVIGRVFDHARSPRPCSRPVLESCWSTSARHQLDLIEPQAARRGAAVHVVIDFVRPGEAMGGCVESARLRRPGREDRVATWALALLSGRSPGHRRSETPSPARSPTTGETASIPPPNVGYLTNNVSHLRYDHALARRSAHRHRRDRKAPAATRRRQIQPQQEPDGAYPEPKRCSNSAPWSPTTTSTVAGPTCAGL